MASQLRKWLAQQAQLALMRLDEAERPVSRLQRQLVRLLIQLGQYEAAEGLARESLAACGDRFGEDDERFLTTQHTLAVLLMQMGHIEEALPVQRAALEGRERVLGVDHLDTLDSKSRLALLLQERNTRNMRYMRYMCYARKQVAVGAAPQQ